MRRRHLLTWAVAAPAAGLAMALLPRFGETEGWIVPISPSLPRPSGAHPVGVRDTRLVDEDRRDPWRPGAARELMVRVFYPAGEAGEAGEDLGTFALSPYLTESVAQRWGEAASRRLGLPEPAVNWQFRTWARLYAPVREGRYPVVLSSPPRFALRTSYTALAEELASHGYVVVAVDHTGEAPVVEFPGRRLVVAAEGVRRPARAGRLARVRARDLRFVAERTDLLDEDVAAVADASRLGAFGELGELGEPGDEGAEEFDAAVSGLPRSWQDAAHYLPALARAWLDNAARLPTPPDGLPAGLREAVARHRGAPNARACLVDFFDRRLKARHGSGSGRGDGSGCGACPMSCS